MNLKTAGAVTATLTYVCPPPGCQHIGESCRGMQDTYAMGNDRVRNVVPLVFIPLVPTRYWIAHSMAKVHTSISKPDPRQCRREEHLALRLKIPWIHDSSSQVLDCHLQGFEREYITNGICTLIRRPQDRVGGPRGAFVVRDGCVGFKSVAEDVKPRRCMDC